MSSAGSPSAAAHRSAQRVFGLDLLRAAAIMMVICAHGFVVLYPHFGNALGIFGHGGFYGVELFFVLSSFLIGQILIQQGVALGRSASVAVFCIRHWFRTNMQLAFQAEVRPDRFLAQAHSAARAMKTPA